MPDFGKNGRLGNQLFQYASMLGLGHTNNMAVMLPYWKYAGYFNIPFPSDFNGYSGENVTRVTEKSFEWDRDLVPISFAPNRNNVFVKGYLQSPYYFREIDVKNFNLKFRPSFKEEVWRKHRHILCKPTIAVHIRRGDYVGNPNYHYLPFDYYDYVLKSVIDVEGHNVIYFSDDIDYCKTHTGGESDTVFFAEGTEIEDLCLMTLCDHFVLSNSTFAWWGAYLGEKSHSKIIRPKQYFAGDLASNSLKDFYPEHWKYYDYQSGGKMNLTDVTFVIPFSFDHPDRMSNINIVVKYLQHHFDTNIIVGEITKGLARYTAPKGVDYMWKPFPTFHRTRLINDMTKAAKTPYVFNWDTDVLVSPHQLQAAVFELRNGHDIVYPYDGTFIRVNQMVHHLVEKYNDVGFLKARKNMIHVCEGESLGGAVGYRKDSFLRAGGENENFISYGAEDFERAIRFEKLGLKIVRMAGAIYHLNHYIGIDSSKRNPHFDDNEKELARIEQLDAEELKQEITKWSWTK